MKMLNCDNYQEFALEIDKEFLNSKKENDVSIIAKFDDAVEIIKELIYIGYTIEGMDISAPEYNDYDDEYLITLSIDGIWCEPMFVEDAYMQSCTSVTYILDNCSAKVISKCHSEKIYEVRIEDLDDEEFDDSDFEDEDFEDEDEDEDDNQSGTVIDNMDKKTHIEYSCDPDDDNIHGFSVSKFDEDGFKAYSYYTTEVLKSATIDKMIRNVGF